MTCYFRNLMFPLTVAREPLADVQRSVVNYSNAAEADAQSTALSGTGPAAGSFAEAPLRARPTGHRGTRRGRAA